jgi:Flp pilus assembly protein TadG
MIVVTARIRRTKGQGFAEFAVTVPALMGVVFGIIGAGFWLYAQFVVTGAAQEGARVAAREVASAADGQQAAERLLVGGLGARGSALSVQMAQDSDTVSVEIVGQFPVSVMLGQPLSVPLHASASLIRERFRPGGD